MSLNQKLTGQENRTLLKRHMVWVEQWKCEEVLKLKCSTCEGDVQESTAWMKLWDCVGCVCACFILHSHCRTDKLPVLICTGIVIYVLLILI